MKKIILLLVLFLTACSYVDDTEIKSDINIDINDFLEQSYNIESTNKSLAESETLELEKLNNNTSNKGVVNIITIISPEENNDKKLEKIIENKVTTKEIIIIEKINKEYIDESLLENITISTDEISIQDQLTPNEIIIEDTTSEDIEELINILFDSSN